jgi:hypothetical protein
MSEWRQRKAFHDEEDKKRREALRERGLPLKQCGCSQSLKAGHCCCAAEQKGKCGCDRALACGKCCCQEQELDCKFAPLREQPFTEKPPEMPREAVMASEIPLKMNLRMVHDIGESRISRVRTGREAVEEIPRQPLKDRCNPDACDTKPCDAKACDAAAAHPPQPPAPIYYSAPPTNRSREIPHPPIPEPDDEARRLPPIRYQNTGYPATIYQPASHTMRPMMEQPPHQPASQFIAPTPVERNYDPAPLLPVHHQSVAANPPRTASPLWTPGQVR